MLTVDPRESEIRVSRRSVESLQKLGVARSTSQGRSLVVDAAFNGFDSIEDGREIHWLARATVGGRPVVLLLMRHETSLRKDRTSTVVVRGVFTTKQAERLLAQNRGLFPFIGALLSGEDSAVSNAN